MATGSTRVDLHDLTPQIGMRYALGPGHLFLALWFSVLFLHLNYIPLFYTDVWGHIAYGNWMLDNRALPTEDPFTPLTEGVPITCTAWLGQVALAGAGRLLGDEGYSTIFAIVGLATYLVFARIFWLQTRSQVIVVAGTAIIFFTGFTRHAIIRPEIFGSLCFAIVLWLLIRTERIPTKRNEWIRLLAVPIVMALWANLHGSFVVGLAVLGLAWLGRVIEVAWKSGRVEDVLQDGEVIRLLLMVELATAAVCANPYGWQLLVHSLVFPTNPNLNDVVEWFRLEMVSAEGITIGASWILLGLALRHGRVAMRPRDVLWLGLFTLAVCLRVRMITWYAPILAIVIAPQLDDIWRRLKPWLASRLSLQNDPTWARPSFNYSLLAVLLIWVTFTLAPCSTPVFGGNGRPEKFLYAKETPRALTAYLREHPPQGQIMNPQWWGDYLSFAGPPNLQVFMTTNAVHVAPARVWKDYLALARGNAGYERKLDLYRINTIVVHSTLQPITDRIVRGLPDWSIVYEDDFGYVATRNHRKPGDVSVEATETAAEPTDETPVEE